MTDWRTRNARALLREFQAYGLASHIRLRRYAGQELAGEVFAPDEDLAGADFRNADLTDARLSRVRLAGADLGGATLTGATLDGADLTGADLSGARLDRASLIGTDLTNAHVGGARWDLARLTGARLPADAVIAGWGAATPSLVPRLQLDPGDGSSADVAWHPAGQLLAVAHGHTVMLWDLVTGKAIAVLSTQQGPVNAVAFSPDGTQLATAGNDGTIRLWNTSTATEGHRDPARPAGPRRVPGQRWIRRQRRPPETLPPTAMNVTAHRTVGRSDTPGPDVQPVVTLLPLRTGGWAVFRGEHEYELHGEPDGSFWWRAGLCRFEPGELDGYGVRNVTPGSGTPPGSTASGNPAGEEPGGDLASVRLVPRSFCHAASAADKGWSVFQGPA